MTTTSPALRPLRRRLTSLRRSRSLVRYGAAYTALLIAAAWVLAAVFVLDLVFEMSVLQRIVVFLAGIAVFSWGAARFAWPLIGRPESDLDMALRVERQHGIDSDLVAALQFESPEADRWGSRRLEEVVIDYAGQLTKNLDVYSGHSRRPLLQRGLVLACTAAVAVGLALAFPGHCSVFCHRLLLLSGEHYPTRTKIAKILVNRELVLGISSLAVSDTQIMAVEHNGPTPTSPSRINSAQGRSLTFHVRCEGEQPEKGRIEFLFSGGQRREIELRQMSLEERKQRLEEAVAKIREAVENPEVDVSTPWRQEVAERLWLDAPDTALPLWLDATKIAELIGYHGRARASAASDKPNFPHLLEQLETRLANWPGDAGHATIYTGQMPKLLERLRYKIYLGDAWTDPADVTMIPLPVVEPRLTPVPPAYAKSAVVVGKSPTIEPAARQISVLEGSQVQVALQCMNGKRLKEAWLSTKGRQQNWRINLQSQDSDGLTWALTNGAGKTPFGRVDEEIRFEMQVTDEDGLHLELPLQCFIRIKADRPPTGLSAIVHRVVLPNAKPKIGYRVTDDYGIAKLLLHTQVERGKDTQRETPVETGDTPDVLVEKPVTHTLLDRPILSEKLPHLGAYSFDLAPLKLVKGDRLRLTLEVIDYRGDLPGQSFLCDPLILEISDESGVLAAISEADEKSEQRLTDIIKQQLGIGDTP